MAKTRLDQAITSRLEYRTRLVPDVVTGKLDVCPTPPANCLRRQAIGRQHKAWKLLGDRMICLNLGKRPELGMWRL